MKIISRYILKECLLYITISLGVFTAILLTLRMLRFASLIVNKGVEPSQIALVFLAIVPAFLEIAIPLATLLGIMLAFGRLSGDSEVIIFRSSGVSIAQLLKPVALLALFCGCMALWVTQTLSPRGFQLLSTTFFDIARSRSTAGLEEGIFNRLGNMTMYAEQIEHRGGDLTKVLLDDRRNELQRRVVLAQSGQIVSDSEKQTITLRLFDGYIHEIVNGKYVLTKFDVNQVILDPDEVLSGSDKKQGKNNREMSLTELRSERDRYHDILSKIRELPEATPKALEDVAELFGLSQPITKSEAKRKARKIDVEIARRFSMPFATFILAILAVPLGIYPPRSQKTWGAGLSAGLGMAVFVIYYALLSIVGSPGTELEFAL